MKVWKAVLALAALTGRPRPRSCASRSSRAATSPRARRSAQVGPYERLTGKLFFAVDPRNSANAIITDIDKAPRNAQGKVEFSSDFQLLKPKQMARANGAVLYEVSNRGGKGMLGFFNRGAGANDEAGDGFLMQNGFTLLWLGWQFDVPQARRPAAAVRADRHGRGQEDHRSGEERDRGRGQGAGRVAVRPQSRRVSRRRSAGPANVLYVRDGIAAARRTLPREDWKFTDGGKVQLSSGFQPGKIYEVVYRSQDPPLVGLGPAAVRDAMAYLKHSDPQPLGIPQGRIARAIAFGISQSGRFLRTFLYYGFNEDEGHRKAFDGVMAHVAGGGRGSFNHRFAQPSRDGHPFLNLFYPTDIFPFTDVEQSDPQTGMKAGLLSRVKPEFLPKVFYTNSSYEYWGRAASLIHTSIDGKADAPLFDTTRVYLFSGGQHGPARFPVSRTIGQQPNNPNDYRWFMRPLLLSMDRWIAGGALPPASRYPRIADGALVPLERFAFPELPGVARPTQLYTAYRMDLGPAFAAKGIVTKEPPELGAPFRCGAAGGRGRQRGRGAEDARARRAARDLHGLEPVQRGVGPDGRAVEHAGLLHPVRADAGRARAREGPAPVDRGALPRPTGLPRQGRRGRAEARAGGLLAGRGSPRIVEQAGRHWDQLVTNGDASQRRN
jgi:hypothetical protein